ncbi:globin family protein [Hymenobacter elongatus]|uniref:Group 1 truncated hemoglobin n=1 Tax=Hymenobacter elongatus TaxID=877208 RepID=A0A4Z0PLP1_9BACT|nr:group 1 truncated hemoglobin [Hymenobacter elongatus]TGE17012.1 group 1 truncated hemoglobin [Hymenobacter elongatus]
MKHSLLMVALLAGSMFTSSFGKSEAEEAPAPTLYDRLGKTEGIATIVDGLVANVGAETKTLNSLMLRSHKPMLDAVGGVNGAAPTDPLRLQRLRNNFVDQLGEATGGPLAYKGMNMVSAHKGMNITNNEFSV